MKLKQWILIIFILTFVLCAFGCGAEEDDYYDYYDPGAWGEGVDDYPDEYFDYINAYGFEAVYGTKFYTAGLYKVYKDGKLGAINSYGEIIFEPEYDLLWEVRTGLFKVSKDGKEGIIDISGKTVVELEYDNMIGTNERFILVAKDGKWGFIDINGKIIFPLIYDEATNFYDGVAEVSLDGKLGYINHEGEFTPLNPKYESHPWFTEDGLAAVKADGKIGFIDRQDEVVIPFIYDWTTGFINGNAQVAKLVDGNLVFYLIDKKGNISIGPKDFLISKRGEMYIGSKSDFIGTDITPPRDYSRREALLDNTGNPLTGFDYWWIGDFKDGLAEFSRIDDGYANQRVGVMNRYGKEIQ